MTVVLVCFLHNKPYEELSKKAKTILSRYQVSDDVHKQLADFENEEKSPTSSTTPTSHLQTKLNIPSPTDADADITDPTPDAEQSAEHSNGRDVPEPEAALSSDADPVQTIQNHAVDE